MREMCADLLWNKMVALGMTGGSGKECFVTWIIQKWGEVLENRANSGKQNRRKLCVLSAKIFELLEMHFHV